MSISLPKELSAAHLPNPILLVGASLDQAIELSKKILGKKHAAKIDSGNHPDFHLLEPEGKSHLHPIAQIHKLIQEMGLPPFEAHCKVFIIAESEKMLPPAANALLKTLEEPNPDTFFLLLSERPDELLPTIFSRLTPVQFPKKAKEPFDMTPFVHLAQRGDWDQLLDSLEILEGEDPGAIFESLLTLYAEGRDPERFLAFANEVIKAKKALDHHVKLRSTTLQLLMNFT